MGYFEVVIEIKRQHVGGFVNIQVLLVDADHLLVVEKDDGYLEGLFGFTRLAFVLQTGGELGGTARQLRVNPVNLLVVVNGYLDFACQRPALWV